MRFPPFCYRQTPFFLFYPLSLIVLSSIALLQGSGLTRLLLMFRNEPVFQWIAISTPWVLLGIGTCWLFSMLVGKEFTFQKIESDGKTISFKTNRYQGKIAVEELEKFWISDQRDWIVLYFLFRNPQIAERLHLKPHEVTQNLQDFFAHHIVGFPRRAFPKEFQRSQYPNPEDIVSTQEEGIQNWMTLFRIVLAGFIALYLLALPWKPAELPYLPAVALGLFWFALRYYPLVRVKKWGFFKKEAERLIFFQTMPLFSVSRQTPYEKEVSREGKIQTQFEPDTVKWLQPSLEKASITRHYEVTCCAWQPEEFSRFQEWFPESDPASSIEKETHSEEI